MQAHGEQDRTPPSEGRSAASRTATLRRCRALRSGPDESGGLGTGRPPQRCSGCAARGPLCASGRCPRVLGPWARAPLCAPS
eukprot:2461388-Prymnesium_polylepis.1